jgi:hypothetical protein
LIWRLAKGGENRLRHHEYADLFRRAGYQILDSDGIIDEKTMLELHRLDLSPPYREMTPEQVAAISSWYVLGAKTVGGGSEPG